MNNNNNTLKMTLAYHQEFISFAIILPVFSPYLPYQDSSGYNSCSSFSSVSVVTGIMQEKEPMKIEN